MNYEPEIIHVLPDAEATCDQCGMRVIVSVRKYTSMTSPSPCHYGSWQQCLVLMLPKARLARL